MLLDNRFWSKVQKTDTCWNWIAGKQGDGYGTFNTKPKIELAHRVVYKALVGEIPYGLELDHTCSNRHCVNPDHLEPVTHRENILRGVGLAAINARKTHCIKGHEYSYKNTYFRPSGKGRGCRICGHYKQLESNA